MYMSGSKRKSPASSETSALSPTISETSTLVMPTPSPKKRNLSNIVLRRRLNASARPIPPETPTVVSESPLLDDLSDYLAPFGTPDQAEEREHIDPPKTKHHNHKVNKKKGGRSTRKRRRRTYKRGRN
jgi:hypothetical protein